MKRLAINSLLISIILSLNACNSGSNTNSDNNLYTPVVGKIVTIKAPGNRIFGVSSTNLNGFGAIPAMLYNPITQAASSNPNLLSPCISGTQTSTVNVNLNSGMGETASMYQKGFAVGAKGNLGATVGNETLGGAAVDASAKLDAGATWNQTSTTQNMWMTSTAVNLMNFDPTSGTLVFTPTGTDEQKAIQTWAACGVGFINSSIGFNTQTLNMRFHLSNHADSYAFGAGWGINMTAYEPLEASSSHFDLGLAGQGQLENWNGLGSASLEYTQMFGSPTSSVTAKALSSDIPDTSIEGIPSEPFGPSEFANVYKSYYAYMNSLLNRTNSNAYVWSIPAIGYSVDGVNGKTYVNNNYVDWQQFTAGAPTIIESANYQGIVNNYHLMMNAASVAALASDDAYAFYRAIEVVANGNESYNNFMQNFVNNTTFYTNSVSQYTNEKSYQRLIPLEDAAEIMREQPTAYNYILAPQVSNVILQCFSYQALVTNLTSNPTSAIENCQLAATNYAQYVIDTIGNSDINLPTDSSSLAVDGLNLSLNGIPTFNWDTSTPVKVGTNLLNQPMSDGIIFNGQTVAYNLPTTTSYTWGRTPSAQISNSLLNILNNDYSGMANLGLNQVVTNKSEANNIDTYNLALFSNGMKFESVALDFGNYQQNIWGQYNTNNLESTLPVIQKGQYLDPASWNGIQSVQLNLPYAVESGSKIPNLKSSSLTVSFASSMVYDLSPIINSLGGYDELPNNVLMSSSPDINSATMQSTANDNTIGIPVTCPMNINGRGSYASNNILVSNSPWTYPAMCSGGNIEAAPITTIQGMLSGTSQSEMFVVEKAKIDFNNYSVNLQPYQLSANNSLTCNYHVSNIVYDQLTQNITYQYQADSSCKIYGLMLVSGLSNYSDFVVQYPFLDYLAQITPAPLSITVPSNFTLMYNGISSTTVSDLKAKLNALSKDRIMQLKQLSIKK